MPSPKARGFSLVELSIVLVILGLLVGGVLSGQSLIRAAELRAVGTEYTRYFTATQTFRDKYFALPGDMTNAQSFWGVAAAGTACFTNQTTTSGTCNGDGDGQITQCVPIGSCPASAQSGEMFQYWRQLAYASLIEGTYTGTSGFTAGNYRDSKPGINVPKSRLSNGGWSVQYLGQWGGNATNSFAGNYGNPYNFGAATGDKTYGAIISPEEAWNIDTKVDDGKPATGRVLIFGWSTCTNAASKTDTSAAYLLTNTNKDCSLLFTQVF